jgi:16S rRNA (guanine527-N7)-methyltransferase
MAISDPESAGVDSAVMPNVSPVSEGSEHALIERLRSGALDLGLELDAAVLMRLVRFLRELERWNRAYNLTAVRDVAEMVSRHVLDSLSVHRFIEGVHACDAGSGAGLPGIPLALAFPALRMTLIDAGSKKARFLRHVASELALANVEVVHARIEDYHPASRFDTVSARALAPLPRMLDLVAHLCRPGGRMLAMQGRRHDEELHGLPRGWTVEAVERLTVPLLDAQRHLVVLRRAADG